MVGEGDCDVSSVGIFRDKAVGAHIGAGRELVREAGVDDLTLFSDVRAEVGGHDLVERGENRDEGAEGFRGHELRCKTLIEDVVCHCDLLSSEGWVNYLMPRWATICGRFLP